MLFPPLSPSVLRQHHSEPRGTGCLVLSHYSVWKTKRLICCFSSFYFCASHSISLVCYLFCFLFLMHQPKLSCKICSINFVIPVHPSVRLAACNNSRTIFIRFIPLCCCILIISVYNPQAWHFFVTETQFCNIKNCVMFACYTQMWLKYRITQRFFMKFVYDGQY